MDWSDPMARAFTTRILPLFAAGFLATGVLIGGTGAVAVGVGVAPIAAIGRILAEPVVELLASLAGGVAAAYAYRKKTAQES